MIAFFLFFFITLLFGRERFTVYEDYGDFKKMMDDWRDGKPPTR